jgi:Ribonuclease toxin, BrnT, of type II toxin-antitoxin system
MRTQHGQTTLSGHPRGHQLYCYNGSMEFEWDESKAARNLVKHGVSFNEAETVFNDPLYVDFFDSDHSDGEERGCVSLYREKN